MLKRNSLILLIIFISGCVPWPKHSTGGYASHYIFSPSYQKALFKNNFPYILSQRLSVLNKQTFDLSKSHAMKCFPARLKLLHALSERIAQEIDSGLFLAARVDLALYKSNLDIIRDLNHHKGCPKPKRNLNWDYLKSRDQ